jgi:hypothetical protein
VTAPEMLPRALHYAGLGWPVFPVDPTTNAPYPRSRGFKDATTNSELVRAWWTAKPGSAIGCPTGIAFDVLDVDHHTDPFGAGVADLPDAEVFTAQARSGGGGWHVYFKPTGLGRRIKFSKYCDWLGTAGYVILPPSRHKSGGFYEWIVDPEDVPFADAPPRLVLAVERARRDVVPDAPSPPRTRPGALAGRFNAAGIIGMVATATEGTRNDKLHWAAWRVGLNVRDCTASRPEGDNACVELERVAVLIGLNEREARRTITSGYRAGLEGRGGVAA